MSDVMSLLDIYYIWPWTTQNVIALLPECIKTDDKHPLAITAKCCSSISLLFFQNSEKCESSVPFPAKLKRHS